MLKQPVDVVARSLCNMLYQQLKTQTIQLGGKESRDLDAQNSSILIPNSGSKVFLDWLTDSGKIRATFTMTYATKVSGKLKLINGLNDPASIQVIHLD